MRLSPEASENDIESYLLSQINEIMVYGDNALLSAEFEECLVVLKEKHLKIGLVLNCRAPKLVRKWIESSKIGGYFDNISISGEVGFHKPDCRLFDDCLVKLGLTSMNCVVVGEILQTDVLGAIRTNMRSIYVRHSLGLKDVDMVSLDDVILAELLEETEVIVDRFSDVGSGLRLNSQYDNRAVLKVGVYLTAKKRPKFNAFFSFEYRRDIDFINLSDMDSLPSLGPYDVLVVKATDLLVINDTDSKRQLELFTQYCEEYPNMVVIDSMEAVSNVIDRLRLCEIIDGANLEFKGRCIRSPPTFQSTQSDFEDLINFPIICKPLSACGSRDSHQMAVVLNNQALGYFLSAEENKEVTWVLQEYINHGGIILKAYVLGGFCEYYQRASLPDITTKVLASPKSSILWFHSHDPVDPNMYGTKPKGYGELKEDDTEFETIKYLSDELRKALKLNLFGFDVILDKMGTMYIVDINYFPSYKDNPYFPQMLVKFLIHKSQNEGSFIVYKGKQKKINNIEYTKEKLLSFDESVLK